VTTKPGDPLSPRQQDALKAIQRHIAARGYAPTIRELGKALNVRPSGAAALLEGLKRKGAIRHSHNRARTTVVAVPVVGTLFCLVLDDTGTPGVCREGVKVGPDGRAIIPSSDKVPA
jgi:hypothetical protein